jgi:hypothetical protein
MRYVCAVAVTLAMLAGPAHAFDTAGESKDPLTLKYEREEKERKENERAYNEQMKRLKAQAPTTTKSDPWSGVRATDAKR